MQALRRGTPLTDEQKDAVAPERSDIITVYRELQARRWHAEDLQPLFAKLGEENTGKTLVAVTALEQVGLIAAVDRGGAKFWELVPAQAKRTSPMPILKCLEECKYARGKETRPRPQRGGGRFYSAKTHLHQPVPVRKWLP